MDILSTARRLEAKLARRVDRAARHWVGSGPRGPFEVLHAVLEAVEQRLEPAGRGTHVFPFNTIKLWVVAPSREARARVAGVLDGDPPLHERLCTRLRALGCDVSRLTVRILYVTQSDPSWAAPDFHIDFSRALQPELSPVELATAPEIRLTITGGSADKLSYALRLDRINLGRCAEIRDSRNRLIRTNHVVFTETADATNDTVSRRHAHIEYSGHTRAFRLVDDHSAHGTTIVRNGKSIGVPAGSRGVRLRSGDEVILGEARLRVRIAGDD